MNLNFVFKSSNLLRYENGKHVSGPRVGAGQTGKVELNSIERDFDFLKHRYLEPSIKSTLENTIGQAINSVKNNPYGIFKTEKGDITVELNFEGAIPAINNKMCKNDVQAKDGKYTNFCRTN